MLPSRAAAAGPFLEERAGTQELFRNRKRQTGHEVFLVRDKSTGELLLIHNLAIDAAASAESRHAVVTAVRRAQDFRHAAVLPVQRVEGAAESLVLAQSFPGGILLRDFVSRNGPFPISHALQIMRSFADALLRAEAMGLTLSQISPEDFVVDKAPAGQEVPAAFGLCPPVPRGWWLEVADPAFASPEQRHKRPCNMLSSLYSAGALLAYMVTGRLPANRETWAGWLEHQDLPQPLKAALAAVLQEEPRQRSQGPAAWIYLLERAQAPPSHTLSELASKARAKVPGPAFGPRAPSSLPASRRTSPPVQKSNWLDAVTLGSVVCLGFVLMWQARKFAEQRTAADLTWVRDMLGPVATWAGNVSGRGDKAEPPPGPKRGDTVSVLPAQAVTQEEKLLHEARQAPAGRQAELYREVLKKVPNNREALHGVVEEALADFPKDETGLRDLRRWISALENAGDPLGDYSRGRLLLEDAARAPNLRSAAEALTTAVRHLEQAAGRGHERAWFPLLQGLVNLHNVQQQAGNTRLAARTERLLFEKIDAMPAGVPVEDTRLLSERLRKLMAERTAQGRPHPQTNLLRRAVQRLEDVASQRGTTVSQAR